MKSLISRESYRPEQRYSGVYHIQGGMVTDADLDERSRITQQRTDDLGDDTIEDGVPAVGGAVSVAADETLSLREGVIYADGVRGELRSRAGASLTTPLSLFEAQADLPEGPGLPTGAGDHVVYADIWDRPVFPLEDPYLADAGLHGAVTAFRTRTMTQLKAAPVSAASNIDAGTGDYPQIGTARLGITPLNAEILADDCDPCADVVSAEQEVSNALWRLEVIDVEGTPTAPGRITLAWSIENASAIAPSSIDHDAFERTNKVYEFFSDITESYLGVFADASHAHHPAFVDNLETTPSPATGPDGNPWPFVRRWDGQAVVDTALSNVESSLGAGFQIEISSQTVTLTVGAFRAELDLSGSAVMAGDYWLIELRRHAPQAERIRRVSETPVGVLHHYCILFRTDNDAKILPATDADVRKLSFPTLSNLPADHVGFINGCEKLYADAENVQEALDNLCDISADDVAFKSNCPELYDNADNVQDALDALCKIDFSVHASFRLLFDWGVLCGIVPRMVKEFSSLVSITPGAFMDRSGRITRFEGGEFDLNDLKLKENVLYETIEEYQKALNEGEACLALAAEDGGEVSLYIAPSKRAYGPDDPGFESRVKKCVDGKKQVTLGDAVAKMPAVRQAVAKKMMLAASGDGAFSGTAGLSAAEANEAEAFNGALFVAYEKVAEDNEVERLKQRIQKAKDDNPLGSVTGSALDVRRMQQATAVFAAFTKSDDERLRACLCDALFPTCPPELGKRPYLVPIACLRAGLDNAVFLREVCPFCCRKQAVTWRALQYFIGERRELVAKQLARVCCAEDEENGGGIKPGLVYDPGKYQDVTISKVSEQFDVINLFTGQPKKASTDYVTKVEVSGLSENEAKKTLTGSGLDVVETLIVDDPKAFEIIQEKSVGIDAVDQLRSGGAVRPGDKVGLLVQNGEARGYVLLERGSGKLPFPTAKIKSAIAVTEEDKLKAKVLISDTNAAKEELTGLVVLRENLSSDVSKLRTDVAALEVEREKSIEAHKSKVDELNVEREKAAQAVKEVEAQFAQLTETQLKITQEISTVNAELEVAKRNRQDMTIALRKGQPVTTIIGNKDPGLVAKLAGAKITSVADLSEMSDGMIKELREAGIFANINAGRVLRRGAVEFLKRPLG